MLNETQMHQLARELFGLSAVRSVRQFHAGHIQQSALVETDNDAFVLQAMNTAVFTDPAALMANTLKITEHLRSIGQPTIDYMTTVDGDPLIEREGTTWRCYRYVSGTALPSISAPEEAQSAARAFGKYAAAIDGLELVEHMVGYHDFDERVLALNETIDRDELGRLDEARPVVELVVRAVDQLRLSGPYEAWRELPVRNAHNDAKAPNCVVSDLGERTVIDLDTTMPGTILADVGELVRSSTRALVDASLEDVMTQIVAVNRGFVSGYGMEMTDAEHGSMLIAGPLMATENAVRFLADHLCGDKYYGADEPDQNLGRATEQVRLAKVQIAAIEDAH